MKKLILFLCFLYSVTSYTQVSNPDRVWMQSYGYFGNTFINPGGIYSIEKNLKEVPQVNYLLFYLGTGQINANATAGIYWDPFSHVGFLNYYELNVRQYLGKRLALQLGAGPGYQLNFTGDNYVFDDDFNFKKRGLRMRAYFAPELSSAIILANKKGTRQWISKVTVLLLVPYNSFTLPVFNYELHYQF